ncbi:unnamed protein product [Tuber melanosporum]|uniref:(Perigord truffle) hypothetical protein n=1 Tax=Tuber melanosporum (strain Mel28) TaxID=656061 RepID=D5GJU4_TUBMM|nr:uncharacterized protein GSTUM_00009197001 [Tuber melanosporum]CAZ84787.1 unnamed protein product [Tuber melanosporum]
MAKFRASFFLSGTQLKISPKVPPDDCVHQRIERRIQGYSPTLCLQRSLPSWDESIVAMGLMGV